MYLFLATHLGSDVDLLCDSLAAHRRCHWSRGGVYAHGADLVAMKTSNAAVHFDKLEFNHQFTCPALYRQCRFVYVLGDPAAALARLAAAGYDGERACSYYRFRLRRLCEMAKKTPGAALVMPDDVLTGRWAPALQAWLGLRDPIAPWPVPDGMAAPPDEKKAALARAAFDKYGSFLVNLLR